MSDRFNLLFYAFICSACAMRETVGEGSEDNMKVEAWNCCDLVSWKGHVEIDVV